MVTRKQSTLTIDEAFQRFYRQEKGEPHVACEWFNQALREGLILWVVDLRVLPPEGLADVPDYFAIPPEERQPVEVKPDYFASHLRVTIEQAPDGGWTAKMTTVASVAMPPADQFGWTVSAEQVDSLLKSESQSGLKRGRKPKFDWASIKREIAQRCIDKKTGRVQVPVPDKEGKLAKAMLDWCVKFDEIPSDPAMRAAVKEICAMLRPD